MYESIPGELKELRQWVCWKSTHDDARPDAPRKVPINALTGAPAQSNSPDTWCSFGEAYRAAGKYDGIGFMFANGYFGVDIDSADDAIVDYRTGDGDNIVAEFIHTLCSYAEYSVSGRGIHIICRGTLPPSGRRRKNVEMYESGRFFVMTGKSASTYADITDATETIKQLHEKYIGGGSAPSSGIAPPPALSLDDGEVVRMAGASKQGAVFNSLYAGQWETQYLSQSEADMALCNMLAFWCRRDEAQMDRLFRASGLIRPKWDRKQSGSTYGAITIQRAAKSCERVYESKPKYRIHFGEEEHQKRKLYTLDDTGNAQRFVDTFGANIRYSYTSKAWMYFDGRRWRQDMDGSLKRMVDEAVEAMRGDLDVYIEDPPDGMDQDDMEKAFLKHIKQSRSNKAKTAMIKESEHHVSVTTDQLDTHKELLCSPGGIVRLKKGDVIPHDRDKYITKITNAEYTDKADAPLWDNFLREIFSGDMELIRYLQKAVGYSLTGSTSENCIFILYGTGRNGKSTFTGTISDMLGDYAINIQPESLMVRPASNGPTSDIARLKGARFVTCAEPNEGVRFNEGIIKQLTGDDPVTASRKYENEFDFYPEFKLWMSTNSKPIIRGTDTGIWSRIRLIPFMVQIPEGKIDRNLRHKLKREMPGIFRWAVDGCLLWQREGLSMPNAVRSASGEYRQEMDTLGAFIDECCNVGSGKVRAQEIFQAYLKWAKDNNEYEMTSTMFGRKMSVRFVKKPTNKGPEYLGLSLREQFVSYGVQFAIVK